MNHNSFFNIPKTATERDYNARWSGIAPTDKHTAFRCYFCGHRIEIGEQYMSVYTNDIAGAGGNPLVCERHLKESIESLRDQWALIVNEARTRFWWCNPEQPR